MIKREPILFEPYLKNVLWGGTKICRYKGVESKDSDIGESWEISEVPGHESVVSSGEYKGQNLTQLIDRFGKELLGDAVYSRYNGKFPLLIKLIDARDNLSVQVHPDDSLAMKRHHSLGKTEMWYIIQADEGAKIYAGLRREISPEEYVESVREKEFADILAVHDSHAGDVFFLPAGRVHAIGAGNLLAEIQESSDITYRIYDYDRRDADGNPRELHTEMAKDAIDYHVADNYKNPPVPDNVDTCELAKCEHFTVLRILVDGEKDIDSRGDSFTVIMCVDGEVQVECDDGTVNLKRGMTALVPAAATKIKLKGKAALIAATS